MAEDGEISGHAWRGTTRAPQCRRCGAVGVTPFEAPRGSFCCAGCALATLVPRDTEGNFPANGALGVAIGVGLLAFNQFLLASLVWTTAGAMERWRVASWVLGLLTALVLFSTQWRVGAGRTKELIVGVAAAVGWTWVIQGRSVGWGLAITGVYGLWTIRGLLRPAPRSGDPI